MRNKVVGYLVIGIAVLMGYVIYSYNAAILDLAGATCAVSGFACPHEQVSKQQMQINLVVLLFVVAIGLYLIFFSKEERIVTKVMRVKEQLQPKKISKEHYQKIISGLANEEKRIFELILDTQGSVMQSELVGKANLTKVKITRILDKLEGKGLIERKRRGMTNIVILKH